MKKIIRFALCALLFASAAAGSFAGTMYKAEAEASYYADKFHGRKTANGEIFNMYAYTAAHKELAFNTMVKVTNLDNGKSVTVRVNDRGPFVAGREIDLSKAAASKIGMIESGTARVSLEIISATDVPTSDSNQTATRLTAGSRWDIQLGAFGSKENAENMARSLLTAGFSDVVYQHVESITRVVVRNVPAENVEEMLERLEGKGFKEHFLRERK